MYAVIAYKQGASNDLWEHETVHDAVNHADTLKRDGWNTVVLDENELASYRKLGRAIENGFGFDPTR